ncbi:hypothetical protein BC830DRAFT_1112987 [Chytriomyces sp. MP71]|nr:hypothetical protein BC830DRAFT_1112987 [Chytriomyces sp. MP71]
MGLASTAHSPQRKRRNQLIIFILLLSVVVWIQSKGLIATQEPTPTEQVPMPFKHMSRLTTIKNLEKVALHASSLNQQLGISQPLNLAPFNTPLAAPAMQPIGDTYDSVRENANIEPDGKDTNSAENNFDAELQHALAQDVPIEVENPFIDADTHANERSDANASSDDDEVDDSITLQQHIKMNSAKERLKSVREEDLVWLEGEDDEVVEQLRERFEAIMQTNRLKKEDKRRERVAMKRARAEKRRGVKV